MPVFTCATDTAKRDAFVAAANEDIAKAKIDADITALKLDVKAAEAKLSAIGKKAGAVRWREFEADVSAATARLRKSIEKATR